MRSKRIRTGSAVCLLLLALLLSGCRKLPQPEPTQPPTVPVTEPVTEPPTEPPTEPETEPTRPPHSDLYLPDTAVEDVITWFNEVCLDAEFSDGGDASLIQKWTVPIAYEIHGDFEPEDVATVETLAAWLNEIPGFPGMHPAEGEANLNIYFCLQEEIVDRMGSNYVNSDGGVIFWYDYNEIYKAIICVRSDIGRTLRDSVILEEIYNGLGPVQDTFLRPDSIIYGNYAMPQELTAVDQLILQLLYNPQIRCGMNAAECEAVIRQRYY